MGDEDSRMVKAGKRTKEQESDEGIDIEVIGNDGREVLLDITSVDHLALLVCKQSFFHQVRTTLNTTVSADLNQGLESADSLSIGAGSIEHDVCNESRSLFLT